MQFFRNDKGNFVILSMVKAIQEKRDLLGEIDGQIGDGDHGMNMNKGFTEYAKRYADKNLRFSQGMEKLGEILFGEIGGSMGPIYGIFFIEMGQASREIEKISIRELTEILETGYKGLREIIEARPGDKTLVDTLEPALRALRETSEKGESLKTGMENMKKAARKGMEGTRNMEARFGRASRLGKRSLGILDAGAVSCEILLCSMAEGIQKIMEVEEDETDHRM